MVGFYWISDIAIFRCICDIPHRSFCNNCNIVISFPRTCKYDCKQILLAINNWCDYFCRFGNIINQSVLIAYTRTIIPIPRLGDFFVGNKVFSWGFFVISNLLLSCLAQAGIQTIVPFYTKVCFALQQEKEKRHKKEKIKNIVIASER